MKIFNSFKSLFNRRKFCGRWLITAYVESASFDEELNQMVYILKNPKIGLTYILQSLTKDPLLDKYYLMGNKYELSLTVSVNEVSSDNKTWYISR